MKTPFLAIAAWALGLHVALIALTFLEVFIYSMLIQPGMDEAFYMNHAHASGPYIGIIAGFILVYYIALRLMKAYPASGVAIALLLPAAYIVLDLATMLLTQTDFGDSGLEFLVSFTTKVAAGGLALWQFRQKTRKALV